MQRLLKLLIDPNYRKTFHSESFIDKVVEEHINCDNAYLYDLITLRFQFNKLMVKAISTMNLPQSDLGNYPLIFLRENLQMLRDSLNNATWEIRWSFPEKSFPLSKSQKEATPIALQDSSAQYYSAHEDLSDGYVTAPEELNEHHRSANKRFEKQMVDILKKRKTICKEDYTKVDEMLTQFFFQPKKPPPHHQIQPSSVLQEIVKLCIPVYPR
jgi:hypothetical protein